MSTRAMLGLHWIGKCILSLVISVGFLGNSFAQQYDAPYEVFEKKNKDKWGTEDKQVSEKLAALEKKFGKKPNIIMVLADDVGWGVLGSYGGGKVIGTPPPQLDKMAREGMKFLSAYSEPSCTPTRLALLTGRQPHRTGVNVVLWPGQKQGIVAEEVTIAELLRDGGYDTAMWGKWHVGDAYDEQLPHNQGFDYAEYSPYNGAVWGWQDSADYPRKHGARPANRRCGSTCRKITSSGSAWNHTSSGKDGRGKKPRK